MTTKDSELTAELVKLARMRNYKIATAESLTAGMVCAQIGGVAGASKVLNGGIVAYTAEMKESLLGVSAEQISLTGVIHEEIARQMSLGACRALNADIGLATTGVAGPASLDGYPAGTVHIAVCLSNKIIHNELRLFGTRNEIRWATTRAVIELAIDFLNSQKSNPG